MGATNLTTFERFKFDNAVRAATVQFVNEKREAEYGQGASSVPQKARNDMVEDHRQRQKQAESMTEQGRNAPGVEDQLDALDDLDDDFHREPQEVVSNEQ